MRAVSVSVGSASNISGESIITDGNPNVQARWLAPVCAESFARTLRRWCRANQGPVGPGSREVLTTLDAIVHGVNDQGDLIARSQSSGPPSDARQMLGAGHLNAPLLFAASLRLD